MKTFEKNNKEGRIPLRRWPARSFVTIPYAKVSTFIPHRAASKQTHTPCTARPSKSATPLEYQNNYRRARPDGKVFGEERLMRSIWHRYLFMINRIRRFGWGAKPAYDATPGPAAASASSGIRHPGADDRSSPPAGIMGMADHTRVWSDPTKLG